MIAKEILDWFPQAQIVDQPIDKEGFLRYQFPRNSGFYWRKLG